LLKQELLRLIYLVIWILMLFCASIFGFSHCFDIAWHQTTRIYEAANKGAMMEKRNFKILVVDDEPDWRTGNRKTLELDGYTVQTAASGQEAIRLAGREHFHLAFLDITMPDMDGLTLLAALKGLDPNLKAVMLTGYATIDRAGMARAEGVVDFLEKIADDPGEKPLGEEIRAVAARVYAAAQTNVKIC
jgi:CheY-like chemotaxis protein